jgi:hypothetical protein
MSSPSLRRKNLHARAGRSRKKNSENPAMTSAIAGACYGVGVIPMRWIEAVENWEYLERPAKELLEVK